MLTVELPPRSLLERQGYVVLREWLDSSLCSRIADFLHKSQCEVTVWTPRLLPTELSGLLVDGPITVLANWACGAPACVLTVGPEIKGAMKCAETLWHQDRSYWGGECPKWSLWIAIDAVTPANGCLRVLPGSHHALRSDQASGYFDHRLTLTADEEARVVDIICGPGDVVCFHDLLIHASHPNSSGAPRRRLKPTYRAQGGREAGVAQARPPAGKCRDSQ